MQALASFRPRSYAATLCSHDRWYGLVSGTFGSTLFCQHFPQLKLAGIFVRHFFLAPISRALGVRLHLVRVDRIIGEFIRSQIWMNLT